VIAAPEQRRVDPQLSNALLGHLDAQIDSARRLYGSILAQGKAIRGRDVEAVVARLSDVRNEMSLRATLEEQRDEVTLGDEWAFVSRYLEVERIRFGDRLSVSADVDQDFLDERVPPFALQTLVENAVRHGASRRPGGGVIEIECRRHHSQLRLEVRDNGPGFPDGWNPDQATGIGLANTRERLRQRYDGAHQFEAHNLPQGGASVCIDIPFRVTPAA
jgi:LytS/YehU family sensor histidine kinase